LQLTGSIAVLLCLLPVQLIIRCFGFGSQGVTQGIQNQWFPLAK
jgi:hypothetical protein